MTVITGAEDGAGAEEREAAESRRAAEEIEAEGRGGETSEAETRAEQTSSRGAEQVYGRRTIGRGVWSVGRRADG